MNGYPVLVAVTSVTDGFVKRISLWCCYLVGEGCVHSFAPRGSVPFFSLTLSVDPFWFEDGGAGFSNSPARFLGYR